MEAILISLAVGLFFVCIVLPLAALTLLAMLDAAYRVDIHGSKLVWVAILLFLPLAGMLLYWAIRPKRYDPLQDTGEVLFTISYANPVSASRPALTLVPVTASVSPAADESAVELDRAA